MKKPEIKETNFSELIQILEQKLANFCFSVPEYQRGYSWDTKNWKWFLQSVEKIIDKNNNRERERERFDLLATLFYNEVKTTIIALLMDNKD